MGEVAKKTLLAALVAWLVTRVLRRLLGLALIAAVLAGGLTIAERHGLDVDGVVRVVRCEARAITRAARQLGDGASSSSPSSSAPALRGVGRCQRAPTSRDRDRGAKP